MATPCAHFDHLQPLEARPRVCEDCVKTGSRWVHLRQCRSCGYVGCCDSSPNRHASGHFRGTGHPVMQSYEPDENWGWCFVDQVFVEPMP